MRREGGIDLIGEAAGAYGRMVNGPQGEASSRYWIGWSQVFLDLPADLGEPKWVLWPFANSLRLPKKHLRMPLLR